MEMTRDAYRRYVQVQLEIGAMRVKRKDLIIVEPLDKVAVIVKYLISCKKVCNKAGEWIRDDKTYSYWVRIYWAKARQSDGVLTLRLLKNCVAKFSEYEAAYQYVISKGYRLVRKEIDKTTTCYTEEQVMLMALAGEIED